jgi:hypothetical protein
LVSHPAVRRRRLRSGLAPSLLLAILLGTSPLRADAATDVPLDPVDIAKLSGGDPSIQEAIRRFRELGSMNVVAQHLRAVRLDPRALDKLLAQAPDGSSETTIRIRLFEDLEVEVVGSPVRASTGTGLRVWSGNVTALRGATGITALNIPCTLAWNDSSFIGNIDLPGGPVRIRTLGRGLHAVFRVDADGLPEEHPPPLMPQPAGVAVGDNAGKGVNFAPVDVLPNNGAMIAPNAAPRKDSAGRFVLGVAFAFTNDAAKEIWADRPGNEPFDKTAAAPLLRDFATTQIVAANKALANNGVRIVLELKGTTQRDIDEEQNVSNLQKYMNSLMPASSVKAKGNEAKGLHCWWAEQQANSLVLVGSFGGNPGGKKTVPGFCGMTSKPSGVASSKQDLAHMYDDPSGRAGHFGYSVVKKACADLHFTFLHELGHQLGADHELAHASPNRVTLMPGAGGSGVASAFGKVVHGASPRIATVEVVGTKTQDRKFRVPAFTASAGVVKAADPSVSSWGDSEHDDATIIVALAEQLSKRTIPKCPATGK